MDISVLRAAYLPEWPMPCTREREIIEGFYAIRNNAKLFDVVLDSLFKQLLDDIIVGTFQDEQAQLKHDHEKCEAEFAFESETPTHDVFGIEIASNVKITATCDCPNCGRIVRCVRFATHLNNCMGLGRRTTAGMHAASRTQQCPENVYEHADDDCIASSKDAAAKEKVKIDDVDSQENRSQKHSAKRVCKHR